MTAPSSIQIARLSPLTLFVTFSRISLSGFGGVLPFLYRAMVEKYKWLTAAEVGELLAMGQVLPGPTICNVAVMIGYRSAGFSGAVAALSGMIVIPMLIIILVGMAYSHYGDLAPVQHALSGMSAVAAGLVIATGLKMAQALPRKWFYALFVVLELVCIAVLRWPLIVGVFGLAPFSIWLALKQPHGRNSNKKDSNV